MQLHFRVELPCWDSIIKKFTPFVNKSLTGQSINLFRDDSEEVKWLEETLLPHVTHLFLETPKIKISALGGLGGNNHLRPHIDGTDPPREDQHWAINIPILNCQHTMMLWYDNYDIGYAVPTPDKTLEADNAQYLAPVWRDEPKIIDTCIMNIPTAVRVTRAHSVINYSNEPRYMLSVRFYSGLISH